MLNKNEIQEIINNIGAECPQNSKIPEKDLNIISILKKNLDEASDKEDVYDVSIDALSRCGYDFCFVAIFRDDRKYSTAARIRVDSELVNRVEDYARKMMPDVTVMRYRIPIFEEGRLFRRFLLESKTPLVSENISISEPGKVIKASMNEIYDNLIAKDSPLKLLIPAFKRMVPYKSAVSAHLFVGDVAVGNIGFGSKKVITEESLNALLVFSKLIGDKLDAVGFGKSYGS